MNKYIVHVYIIYMCMCACMYVCMYVCLYVCVYVCMHACMHACMYLFLSPPPIREVRQETTVGHGQTATTTSMMVRPPTTNKPKQPKTKPTPNKNKIRNPACKCVSGMYKPVHSATLRKEKFTSHKLRLQCTRQQRSQCCF